MPQTITGPFTHKNLSVFLVHDANVLESDTYVTLEEALDQQKVAVEETGNVRELLIESWFEDKDVFIQAGDIVRGGRQDRTFACDYVVPAKSGKMPIPSFCVEHGRWHRRGAEADRAFSSSKHYLASSALRMAAREKRDQREVWAKIAEQQAKLSKSVGSSVHSQMSPSSYELALDHDKIKERSAEYLKALSSIAEGDKNVVGFAFAINGRIVSAEVYGSNSLFNRLWRKLLESAVIETLAEAPADVAPESNWKAIFKGFGKAGKSGGSSGVSVEDVRAVLERADSGPVEEQEITKRIRLVTKKTDQSLLFETQDSGVRSPWIHRNYTVLASQEVAK